MSENRLVKQGLRQAILIEKNHEKFCSSKMNAKFGEETVVTCGVVQSLNNYDDNDECYFKKIKSMSSNRTNMINGYRSKISGQTCQMSSSLLLPSSSSSSLTVSPSLLSSRPKSSFSMSRFVVSSKKNAFNVWTLMALMTVIMMSTSMMMVVNAEKQNNGGLLSQVNNWFSRLRGNRDHNNNNNNDDKKEEKKNEETTTVKPTSMGPMYGIPAAFHPMASLMHSGFASPPELGMMASPAGMFPMAAMATHQYPVNHPRPAAMMQPGAASLPFNSFGPLALNSNPFTFPASHLIPAHHHDFGDSYGGPFFGAEPMNDPESYGIGSNGGGGSGGSSFGSHHHHHHHHPNYHGGNGNGGNHYHSQNNDNLENSPSNHQTYDDSGAGGGGGGGGGYKK